MNNSDIGAKDILENTGHNTENHSDHNQENQDVFTSLLNELGITLVFILVLTKFQNSLSY
jgi:hypothetical protein